MNKQVIILFHCVHKQNPEITERRGRKRIYKFPNVKRT